MHDTLLTSVAFRFEASSGWWAMFSSEFDPKVRDKHAAKQNDRGDNLKSVNGFYGWCTTLSVLRYFCVK